MIPARNSCCFIWKVCWNMSKCENLKFLQANSIVNQWDKEPNCRLKNSQFEILFQKRSRTQQAHEICLHLIICNLFIFSILCKLLPHLLYKETSWSCSHRFSRWSFFQNGRQTGFFDDNLTSLLLLQSVFSF
jgi:hypothetical protein